MNLYCLSGLGADEAMFKKLRLEGMDLIHIPWPEDIVNITMPELAAEMQKQVDVSDDYGLMGVSFGGMVACEMAKIQMPSLLILLSTITGRSELPWHFKCIGAIGIHKLIPIRLGLKGNWLTNYFFGASTRETKKLLNLTLTQTDPRFAKAAITMILSWKGDFYGHYLRLHGQNDRILPPNCAANAQIIKGAGHLMILENGVEINKTIESFVSSNISPN